MTALYYCYLSLHHLTFENFFSSIISEVHCVFLMFKIFFVPPSHSLQMFSSQTFFSKFRTRQSIWPLVPPSGLCLCFLISFFDISDPPDHLYRVSPRLCHSLAFHLYLFTVFWFISSFLYSIPLLFSLHLLIVLLLPTFNLYFPTKFSVSHPCWRSLPPKKKKVQPLGLTREVLV